MPWRRSPLFPAALILLFALQSLAADPALVTLHSFDGTDGSAPEAVLVQARDGDLYGTTAEGGPSGVGTIFKITLTGALTRLYSFNYTDGANPFAGLVQASNGDLYGTTAYGGRNTSGTAFKITPGGALTTLYSFCYPCTEGGFPYDGLVQARNGDLYGTAESGGAGGNGTVFKITPSGALTTLYSFWSENGRTDGANPYAGLVQASNSSLYGTTYYGGANGEGTIFKITPSGARTTLYSFCSQTGCPDGAHPYAGLIQASDSNLYGTTHEGGANGWGTIFKITPSGALTTLHSFCTEDNCADGGYPFAGLVQASDGNLYGTTCCRGPYGGGTIFRITPSGPLTTLYSFCSQSGCTDGYYPAAGLVQASNGNLYGTTTYGGAGGIGTVFRLSLGLPSPAETPPTSQ